MWPRCDLMRRDPEYQDLGICKSKIAQMSISCKFAENVNLKQKKGASISNVNLNLLKDYHGMLIGLPGVKFQQ